MVNANDLLEGIDNAPTLDDDETYELAQSLWLEVMSTMNDSEDMIFSFIDYLELIKTRAKGFVYRLASSENGTGCDPSRKKLLVTNTREKIICVLSSTKECKRCCNKCK